MDQRRIKGMGETESVRERERANESLEYKIDSTSKGLSFHDRDMRRRQRAIADQANRYDYCTVV